MTKRSPNEGPELVKRWVTKYALTQGVFWRRGIVSQGYFYYGGQHCGLDGIDVQVSAKDFHLTATVAMRRAREKRIKKCALLKRQLLQLQLRFADLEFVHNAAADAAEGEGVF